MHIDIAVVCISRVSFSHYIVIVERPLCWETTASPSSPTPAGTGGMGSGMGMGGFPNMGNMGSGGLPGMGGLGGMDMQQAQQQMMQNPEMMNEMMNSPMMQAMMDNPEVMRTVMTSNPQIRALMDSNPQVAQMFNDPAMIREMMATIRNPNLRNEMTRSNDRAMANIESLPGGSAALARMYNEVQEPLMNATTQQQADANPFAAFARGGTNGGGTGDNAQPAPNPWAPNPTAQTPASNTGAANTTNTSFGSGTAGAAQANPFAAMGGMGGMPIMDPAQMQSAMAMMQNPAMRGMMESAMQDPRFRETMTQNPMVQNNPMLRAILNDPEATAMMFNPTTLNAIMQQSGAGMPGMAGAGAGDTGSTAQNAALMNAFAGMGGMGASAAPADARPPAERFATQLTQLQDMGFYDEETNINALTATGGNVNAAVERLLQ
ncbi:hypothetical protein SARC_08203 [Sphaeroforma arctica JP610]|uniref:Ubiquilin n=1 Tax=Sphaeroforma arctica JP610 TaxID=667725 RepID=A0A0L0FU06_9EUKA|nr:hypothetical protein SARC_08203 [Sphaeroforma arctica JP610]KNC79403.1 hypothetical protein SARC_08203 [Sphaeroforma arctica JP610]|eukprot:XP_014153305.1 hypothetical protein SARC_08203 [Sphaeroforma arctica JP610]